MAGSAFGIVSAVAAALATGALAVTWIRRIRGARALDRRGVRLGMNLHGLELQQQPPRRRSAAALVARAMARVAGRAGLVPVSVLAGGFGLDAIRSDRAVQRRGYSRLIGLWRAPRFRELMSRSCNDGVPAFLMVSKRGDALLGEGNCSYGPIHVTDSYHRWRWQVSHVELPELGESLTLVRWRRGIRRTR